MALRADDGTILPVKEAIVLDQEGEPIARPEESYHQSFYRTSGSARVFHLKGWISLVLFFVAVVALAMGGMVIVGFVVLFLVLQFFRKILKSLNLIN